MTPIDFWPILVASVVAFAIGALWYSPILFGKQWMALSGKTAADAAGIKMSDMWKSYVTQFIFTIVTYAVLAFIVAADSGVGAIDGAWLGFLVWLGFNVPIGVSALLWEEKPLKLVLINALANLVTLVIGGSIIGAWR